MRRERERERERERDTLAGEIENFASSPFHYHFAACLQLRDARDNRLRLDFVFLEWKRRFPESLSSIFELKSNKLSTYL